VSTIVQTQGVRSANVSIDGSSADPPLAPSELPLPSEIVVIDAETGQRL
jgi:hypothetical protein